MSHFSKIKTKITNQDILIQTLQELKINYKLEYKSNVNRPIIHVLFNKYQGDIIPYFIWDNNNSNYEFIADSKTWSNKNQLDLFVEKLNQKYAYNTIIIKSNKQGFIHTNSNLLQDGSIQLVLERWN
uniref:Uncharacterized protein ycf35 n=1 Tax=Galaxaura rugosa TaxID=268570 RepID=A0A1G4NSR6_9FLOR|nr:Hypothetical protein ycf35 [Galaxaura rugosa]SCW21664.1 Hypothetical protein ycf35 [Galaxaura rugosa]